MLIGRKLEIKKLEKAYYSKEAEFIVVYGRRRVGKTFLIREFFSKQNCKLLQATGLHKGTLAMQLQNFMDVVSRDLNNNIPIKTPDSWQEAFKILQDVLTAIQEPQKIIIFLDELPWMATRKSGLLEMIDYYWNQYWSRNPNIIFVACGSNASWLIKKIIYNTGGLHNRCTLEIKLDPFTLAETNEFLNSNQIHLNKNHVLDLYMALGGIPYYLKYVERDLTATENIQNIFFGAKAALHDEFKKLFDSLFKNAPIYVELIKLIAQRRDGISRIELENISKYSKGGRLTERLEKLEQASFISKHIPWNKVRGEYYKVIDEFCLFYFAWIDKKVAKNVVPNYWLQQTQKPAYHSWAGYAFEAVCQKHVNQIINALHIQTAESIGSWRYFAANSAESGAQIDLLIDRADGAITVCEVKYTHEPFLITKEYNNDLLHKLSIFKHATKTHKQIFMVLISANGVKKNQYSNELLNGVIVLEDLFA